MAYGKTVAPTCGTSSTTENDQGTRIPMASPRPGTTGKEVTKEKQKVLGSCELVLTRTTFSEKCTIGELSHRGCRLSYTLEDVEREKKVYAETAIPLGTYEVKLTHSPQFKKVLPLLLNVPGFTGIRIHSGKIAKHTEGCILVGNTKGKDAISDGPAAMKALMKLLEPYAAEQARIRILIRHGKAAEASEP